MEIKKELIGEFIDATVDDQLKARELLKSHPDLIEARWIHGETVLHFLVVESFIEGVRLLAELGANVNSEDNFGDRPIISAAVLGNDRVAEILLTHGADPNVGSKTMGPALHCAVRSGNPRLVDLLLKAGAKSDALEGDETVFDVLPRDLEKRNAVISVLSKHGICNGAG